MISLRSVFLLSFHQGKIYYKREKQLMQNTYNTFSPGKQTYFCGGGGGYFSIQPFSIGKFYYGINQGETIRREKLLSEVTTPYLQKRPNSIGLTDDTPDVP